MMLRRKKLSGDEGFDQLQREVLLAVKVSEEEIEEVATSPDLYEGVRLRIARERRQRSGGKVLADDWRSADSAGLNFIRALLVPSRPPQWILTAAAVLLLVAVALLLWLPKQPRESSEIAQPVIPQTVPSRPLDLGSRVLPASPQKVLVAVPLVSKQQRRIYRRDQPSDNHADEIATDFLPLTFTADSTAPESGHLVRVTIPRSALLAMGLPMNAERAGELVRADVFIGDDGLARAIRFIQ
ncbi:MAG TPA: hypothetical protein VNO24_02370 [Blastocatellia bacterium]|nr:hypothetical protein [Blastocatellia bacterium]